MFLSLFKAYFGCYQKSCSFFYLGDIGCGFGRQRGHTELYQGAEYVVDFLPKCKLEVAIDDDRLDQVLETIVSVANTGRIGDGKIFVMSLGQAVRIRTGETNSRAI